MELSGLFIAYTETSVCLIYGLLQIAPAARSVGRSGTCIGAGNFALYAAAGALPRGCFLHKRHFAYLLGKNQVCLLLTAGASTAWSRPCLAAYYLGDRRMVCLLFRPHK